MEKLEDWQKSLIFTLIQGGERIMGLMFIRKFLGSDLREAENIAEQIKDANEEIIIIPLDLAKNLYHAHRKHVHAQLAVQAAFGTARAEREFNR